MKLVVQGIEEIELTDPQGFCKLAALPALPRQSNPIPTGIYPTPQIPTPMPGGIPGWPTISPIQRAGDVAVPHRPPIYTRNVPDPNDPFTRAKWGIGGPMIQQAGDPKDADKFEKNWQAKMNGEEGQDNGNQHTH